MPRILYSLRKAKKCLEDRSIPVKFSKLVENKYDFLKFNFSHFTSHALWLFLSKKET